MDGGMSRECLDSEGMERGRGCRYQHLIDGRWDGNFFDQATGRSLARFYRRRLSRLCIRQKKSLGRGRRLRDGKSMAKLRETWKNESLKPQDVSIIAGEIAKGGVKMIPGTINYKVSHLLSSFPSCVEWALSFLSGDLSGPFLFSTAI